MTRTPFSTVTEVRSGPVIPEEIGPTSGLDAVDVDELRGRIDGDRRLGLRIAHVVGERAADAEGGSGLLDLLDRELRRAGDGDAEGGEGAGQGKDGADGAGAVLGERRRRGCGCQERPGERERGVRGTDFH